MRSSPGPIRRTPSGSAEQAKIEGLNVKAYYSAVAVAFPAFRGKFGASAENVLGAGGIQD